MTQRDPEGHPNDRRLPWVKLIAGLLYPRTEPELFERIALDLPALFGEIERVSEPYDFNYTDYYREISPYLLRRFFSFRGLRHPADLADWKWHAVELEAESAAGGGRRVNVDPGYLDGARLVLASTKDHAQRVYLRDGIFAEVTLCRRKSGWESFYYTFPDFKGGAYHSFLDAVRGDWKNDMRARQEQDRGVPPHTPQGSQLP